MRKGRIIDVNELGKAILSVIDSFEKKLGEGLIDSVVVGVSHPKMIIKRIREQKRLITGVVEPEDISHFDKLIEEIDEEPNYEVIKTIPITWIIDEDVKVKDPLGMKGRKLEMVADVFLVPQSFYNSLLEVFELIGIDIEDIVPNIL
jgi:cell division protein FtsA